MEKVPRKRVVFPCLLVVSIVDPKTDVETVEVFHAGNQGMYLQEVH